MITLESSGSFKKTSSWLERLSRNDLFKTLDQYGREGVAALSSATPVESGATASAWNYEIRKTKGSYSIVWTNGNVVGGIPVAILLQYGHGTGTGGYVQGRDFINPAMRPVFDRIEAEVRKAVTSA